jgi:quercetin dioxygenase-like cupin family protein
VDLGRAVIIDRLGSLELTSPAAAAAAVYDRPIGLRLLHHDPTSGEEHYLVRYPSGLRGWAHTHTSAHTIVVLEGSLDANGQVIGPGAYAHFPAGEPMRHQAGGEDGCLFVILFHGPFDVRIVGDEPTDHGYRTL